MVDFVYAVGHGENNPELKFSLRSLEKFAPSGSRVFVFGGKPSFLSNAVNHIHVTQDRQCKFKNVLDTVRAISEYDELDDEIVFMNDDFIALRSISIDDLRGAFKGKLSSFGSTTSYKRAFDDNAEKMRVELGYDALDYELHLPMILSRACIRKMFEDHGETLNQLRIPLWRSWYGNMFITPDNKTADVKMHKDGIPHGKWISTRTGAFGSGKIQYPLLNGYLNGKFYKPSRYEIIR